MTMLLGAGPGQGEDPPVLAADVPAGLADVVGALVAAEPELRPASAAEALAALERPALAWRADVIGDVEVFDQLPPDEPHLAPAFVGPTTSRAGLPAAEAPSTPPARTEAPSSSPATRHGSRTRTPYVVAALVALAAVVGLLVWSPWGGTTGGAGGGSRSGSTPAGSPTTTTRSASTTAPSTSDPSSTSTPAQTQGTVDVSPVIVRVGQPCEFSDVGQRATTTSGVEVVCTYDDGSYAWQRP